MADVHEYLIRSFRQGILPRGVKPDKSPMPTWRPDFFAAKKSPQGRIVAQIAVEAEIKSTLYSDHTAEQLVLMQEFIEHQKEKGIKVRGYLLVPKGKEVRRLASWLVESLFPTGTSIALIQK